MILDAIFSRATTGVSPADPPGWFTRIFGGSSAAGVDVTEDGSLGNSAFFNGVTLLSESLGVLPLHLYERMDDGGKRAASDHPVYQLLHRSPNPETTPSRFKRYLQAQKILWGNGYAEIQRNRRGEPIALWPIHASRVLVERKQSGELVYKIAGSILVEIPAADMLHIIGFSKDGVTGLSALSVAREALGLGIASEQYAAKFFKNSAVPPVLLEHPQRLSTEAASNLRESWKRIYGGDNQHSVAILEEGMKAQILSMSAEDSQLLQTRSFQIAEIARFLNIPPHKLKDLSKATFSNIEQQSIEYVGDCILPHCVEFEEEIDRKLLAIDEQPRYFTEFNMSGMLRADAAGRSSYYHTMLTDGVYTINEIRSFENMNPIGDAGDQHFIQMNMTTVERIGEEQAAFDANDGNADDAPQQRRVSLDMERIKADLMPVFVASADRLVRKEVNAVKRAAVKYHGNVKAFNEWAASFYSEHEGTTYEALEPPIRTMCRIIDAAVNDGAIRRYAQASCKASLTEAVERFKAGTAASMVEEWQAQRPATVAAMLTDWVCDGFTAGIPVEAQQ